MPSDLWGKAVRTSTNAQLALTSEASLVSVKVGTTLVVAGTLMRVSVVQKTDTSCAISCEVVGK